MKKQSLFSRVSASVLALALFFTVLPPINVSAVSDELTGTGATGKPAATIASEVSTTLAADISSAATTATLSDGTDFADGDLALIGGEVVTITTMNIDTVTVDAMTRATTLNSVSTTAAPHFSGDTVRNIDQNVQIVFESGSHAIVTGEKIVITVPPEFDNFENLAAADVTTTLEGIGTSSVSATETFVSSGGVQTITITADGDFDDANEAATVVIGDINQLDMPATPGNYAFHIAVTTSGGTIIETGYALFSWASEVRVRAVVSEALILTIDNTSVDLNVDPSVNSGEDFSEKTILTVKTNATSGYKIQGKLLDSSSNATLKSGSNTIAAGNAETTENKFGYVGYNGDGAASPTITGTTTRTLAEIKSDVSGMSSFTSSLANLTNVTATAGDAAPTADGLNSAAATNETKHTIYYALNVDYLTPAGTYDGTVTYVALPTF